MRPKLINISVRGNSIGILSVLMTLICLGACSPKHSSYSEYYDVAEDGWIKETPCEFMLQYPDSSSEYEMRLSFCFAHEYCFRNISATVDFIKSDSLVKRTVVDAILSDTEGNWEIPGFGVAYQSEHFVASRLRPGDFDKVMVWQGLDCDTLTGVTKVGISLVKVR